MFEAYRQVKVNKEWHKYLGIYWEGKIYRYTCLPFGLASAPKIYSEFAQTINKIITNSNPNIWKINNEKLLFNYLDDFWAGHPDYFTACLQFLELLEMLIILGIPTQWKKVSLPSKKQKLLGFIFDIERQVFYVPQEKIEKICNAIDELINNRERTRSNIASVKGKLIWTAQVIRASRIFLRGLDETINKRNRTWHQKGMPLTRENIKDLEFWKQIIQTTRNEMSFDYFLRDPKQGDIHVWTDAATSEGTGIGGFTSTGLYFQVKWSDIIKTNSWPTKGSTGPELLAVVSIATYLKEEFKNKSIIFHCDNAGVIPMISEERCSLRNESHMRLLRYFVAKAFDYKFKYWALHIPGVENIEADKLSRFMDNPFERLFKPLIINEHTLPLFQTNFQPNTLKYIELKYHTRHCYKISQNRSHQ